MYRRRFRSGVSLFCSLVPVLLLLEATSTGSQSISMIGNDFSTVTEGGTYPGSVKGSVLLLKNASPSFGIIFAFSVLVANTSPFTLQLYHIDASGKTYHLGQSFTITPSVQKGLEDIYIESLLNRRCVIVRPGDRLAFRATSDTPAVQFNFNTAATSNPSSDLCAQEQTDGTVPCATNYPYWIRAAAYYIVSNDSSLNSSSSDDADCPFGTLIPRSHEVVTIPTTTVPLITGAQGAMGAMGIQGVKGFAGNRGAQGSTGQQGLTGPLGPLGFTGVKGIQGATGSTGVQGVIGETGATGNLGLSEIGDLGIRGIRGPPGPMGHNFTFFLNRPDSRKLAVYLSAESSDSTDPFWSSSRAIWATYLWMALVSLLLLIVVIVAIITVCIHRSFSASHGSAPGTVADSRMNIMDDDAPSNYSDLGTVEH